MDSNFLLSPAVGLGPAEWVFFIASIAVALGGAYIAFLRSDENAVRATALRQLGYALLASGVIGVLIGVLRLAGIGVAPLWITIATILFVIVAVGAIYYATSIYPQQVAAAQQSNRNRPARQQRSAVAARTSGAEASPAAANGLPRPTNSRRESRRDRKRRGK